VRPWCGLLRVPTGDTTCGRDAVAWLLVNGRIATLSLRRAPASPDRRTARRKRIPLTAQWRGVLRESQALGDCRGSIP